MKPHIWRQGLVLSGCLALTALLLALAIIGGARYPAVRTAFAGAAPAALGAALAGAYRLEQRLVNDRLLGLLFLAALGLSYALFRQVPAPLAAPALLVAWFLGPAAWASGRALDAWLQAGIPPPARIVGSALCGVVLAALIPLATVTIDDLPSGAVALAALTLRLVTRMPVPVLLGAGAVLRLLLPWTGQAG